MAKTHLAAWVQVLCMLACCQCHEHEMLKYVGVFFNHLKTNCQVKQEFRKQGGTYKLN